MEKMMRVNLLVPPRLWPALAKAAAESGHPRASFVRMVLQQACEKGAAPVRTAVVSRAAAPVKREEFVYDGVAHFRQLIAGDVPPIEAYDYVAKKLLEYGVFLPDEFQCSAEWGEPMLASQAAKNARAAKKTETDTDEDD